MLLTSSWKTKKPLARAKVNFNTIWHNALEKTGLLKKDKNTGWATMRPHGLRKFFRLRMGKYGRDESECLMGHQKGLNAIYARFVGQYGDERLEEVYKKAIPDLSVYGRSILVARADKELKERLRKAEDIIDGLLKDSLVKEKKIEYLTVQNEEREKTNKELKVDHDALKRRFEQFAKILDMSPKELNALSEVVRDYLEKKYIKEDHEIQQQEREFQEQWMKEHPEFQSSPANSGH